MRVQELARRAWTRKMDENNDKVMRGAALNGYTVESCDGLSSVVAFTVRVFASVKPLLCIRTRVRGLWTLSACADLEFTIQIKYLSIEHAKCGRTVDHVDVDA